MGSPFRPGEKSPALFYAAAFWATAVLSLVGVASGQPWLLAVLNLMPPVVLLFHFIRLGKSGQATAALLGWAYALGFFMVLWVCLFPERAVDAVFHGAAYKEEMFHWMKTGEGAEGNPLQFIPQHLIHLAVFLVLSIFSGGVLGLLMGVLLVDYMAFYTGSVILAAEDKALAAALAWHPWSLFRIAAFVLLGVVTASLVHERLRGRKRGWKEHRTRILWAAALLALDIVLKAALAPPWRLWLLATMPF